MEKCGPCQMQEENKRKSFFFFMLASLLLCLINLVVGIQQIIENPKTFSALGIFCVCHLVICINVTYITIYVAKNRKYSWQISMHVFVYIVFLFIAAVIVLNELRTMKLVLVLGLSWSLFLIFVMLFLSNFFMNMIFDEIVERKKLEKVAVRKKHLPKLTDKKVSFDHISLFEAGVNREASTSERDDAVNWLIRK